MGKNTLRILASVLAAVVLAGVPSYFAVRGAAELRDARALYGEALARGDKLSRELEEARAQAQSAGEALEDAEARLGDVEARRVELETGLDEANGQLSDTLARLNEAEARIEELSRPVRFDPEGPAYQQLYPDFYAPQPLDASQTPGKVIYLTFDDGPSARTQEVLDTLEKEGVKATFFVVGRSGAANRDKLRAISQAGHTLAMHSYSHDYKKIYASVDAFLEDMYQVFTLIRDETGTAPTFYRFPGGSLNSYDYGVYEDIISEMLRRGFVHCDWNMSAQDATKTPLPVSEIISNIMSAGNVERGVVLMHDSSARTTTVQALPELISTLRSRGYTFAALTPEVKPVVYGYRKPALEG